tara:strand:+ start:378 stop:1622 length:1245 start_codon:yes stop_codon:yes gene_type:complete
MATYTSNGGIKKIATGDESGTWGSSTNSNFDIIDRLTNGVVNITLTGATETVTTTDGTISDGMSKVLVFGGTPGVAVTVTIAPNDAQKVYFIKNNSGQTITISQGSGSTVDILDTSSSIVYCDGAGSGASVIEITAGSAASNTIDVTSFTATAAQTTFSVTYSAGNISVYQNGVLLKDTTDYTATNGTSVVLASGAAAGDSVDVVAYATFTVTDTYTKAQADARYLLESNNLSDLVDAAAALTNLGVTATAAELNTLDGITATTAELNYVDGVTSAIQTQLDAKMTPTYTGDVDITGELIADSYNETYAAVTSTSNATTVNCETGNTFSHTLTENTTFTFSNPPASGTGYTMSIEIIQDSGASGFTVTWPTSVDWPAATAPTLTATASAKDIFVFTTRDGGTNWYGFTAGQALA